MEIWSLLSLLSIRTIKKINSKAFEHFVEHLDANNECEQFLPVDDWEHCHLHSICLQFDCTSHSSHKNIKTHRVTDRPQARRSIDLMGKLGEHRQTFAQMNDRHFTLSRYFSFAFFKTASSDRLCLLIYSPINQRFTRVVFFCKLTHLLHIAYLHRLQSRVKEKKKRLKGHNKNKNKFEDGEVLFIAFLYLLHFYYYFTYFMNGQLLKCRVSIFKKINVFFCK